VYFFAACLPVLNTLNISHNRLKTVESIEHVTECEYLSVLDLSHNDLEDPKVIDVLAEMKSLVSLFYYSNEDKTIKMEKFCYKLYKYVLGYSLVTF